MEQLNRFIEAGVPIMGELEKQTGLTGNEVFKLVSQGKIGFKDVETALNSLELALVVLCDALMIAVGPVEGTHAIILASYDTAIANRTNPISTSLINAYIGVWGIGVWCAAGAALGGWFITLNLKVAFQMQVDGSLACAGIAF